MIKDLLCVTALIVTTLATSCTNNMNESIEQQTGEKIVNICFGGDMHFEPFTRAANGTENVWIFDYMDGSLVQTIHGSNESNPQINLKYGLHNLYFLVSAGENPNHMSAINVITWQKVADTFWAHSVVMVDESFGPSFTVEMERVVTMLRLKSTDNIPERAASIKIVPNRWSYAFNYITGESGGYAENHPVVFDISDTSREAEIELYGIASRNETAIDFYVSSISKSDGVIKYITLPNVPFVRNRVTTMSGNLFDNATTSGDYNYFFQKNTTWNAVYNGTW